MKFVSFKVSVCECSAAGGKAGWQNPETAGHSLCGREVGAVLAGSLLFTQSGLRERLICRVGLSIPVNPV